MNICSASRLFSTPSLDFMLLLLLLFYSAVHKGSRVNSRVSCTIEWIVWLRMVYALCSSYIYGVNFVWYLCWFPLEIFISNILTIKLKWMKKRCCWDGNHTQTANARGCIKWNWNKSGSHWKWKFSNEMDILHFIFRRNTQINKNPPKSKCLFNCGAVESKKKKSFTFYLLQLSRTRCSTHATSMPYYLWLFALQLYLFLSVVESVWAKGKQTAYASQTTLGFFFYPVHHEFMLYVCLIGSHL